MRIASIDEYYNKKQSNTLVYCMAAIGLAIVVGMFLLFILKLGTVTGKLLWQYKLWVIGIIVGGFLLKKFFSKKRVVMEQPQ